MAKLLVVEETTNGGCNWAGNTNCLFLCVVEFLKQRIRDISKQ